VSPSSHNSHSSGLKFVALGLLFALLWASASTATKIGLESAQPFVIAFVRFLIAGSIMLLASHIFMRKRMPNGKEWKQLMIYGVLNITAYLGFYVIAMQNVSAGFGSLAVATNPVFIALLASLFFGYKLRFIAVISMFICFAGVTVVAYPLMKSSLTTVEGILYMTASMISYSIGTLYYSRQKWKDLHILTINGWQTLLGGIFLLPFLIYTYEGSKNVYDATFWLSVSWLAFPVSILAVLVWLHLLKENPIKSSFWLFLCPIFGFFVARLFVNEPITLYTVIGVILVIVGLYLLNKKKDSNKN
jgi:drug/metabolite transporter (DMT)-like permease